MKPRTILFTFLAGALLVYLYQLVVVISSKPNSAPVERHVHHILSRYIDQRQLPIDIKVVRPVGISLRGCRFVLLEPLLRDCGAIRLITRAEIDSSQLKEILDVAETPCRQLKLLAKDKLETASDYFGCGSVGRRMGHRLVVQAETYSSIVDSSGITENKFQMYYSKAMEF